MLSRKYSCKDKTPIIKISPKYISNQLGFIEKNFYKEHQNKYSTGKMNAVLRYSGLTTKKQQYPGESIHKIEYRWFDALSKIVASQVNEEFLNLDSLYNLFILLREDCIYEDDDRANGLLMGLVDKFNVINSGNFWDFLTILHDKGLFRDVPLDAKLEEDSDLDDDFYQYAFLDCKTGKEVFFKLLSLPLNKLESIVTKGTSIFAEKHLYDFSAYKFRVLFMLFLSDEGVFYDKDLRAGALNAATEFSNKRDKREDSRVSKQLWEVDKLHDEAGRVASRTAFTRDEFDHVRVTDELLKVQGLKNNALVQAIIASRKNEEEQLLHVQNKISEVNSLQHKAGIAAMVASSAREYVEEICKEHSAQEEEKSNSFVGIPYVSPFMNFPQKSSKKFDGRYWFNQWPGLFVSSVKNNSLADFVDNEDEAISFSSLTGGNN